jgi:hypothetical protein
MAMTYDRNYVRLYINGELAGISPLNEAMRTNAFDMMIGDDFDGTIDEVRICDRALTAAEIKATYQLSAGTYYWRVAADDGVDPVTYSETRSFSLVGPDVPVLLSPDDDVTVATDTPQFVWSSTAGPDGTYTFEYAQDSLFTTGVVQASGLTDTTYTPSSMADDTYYWHVAAIDSAAQNSGYQAHPFELTILTGGGAPQITLVAPPDDSTTTDSSMELQVSVTEPEGNPMTIWIYGDTTDASDLLYYQENAPSPTSILYDWIAPVLEVEPGVTLGLWHFDENSGSTAADATTYGHDGTISGAIWSTAGQFGNALDFDGIDDYVEVASTADLQLTSDFSVEAWVKADTWPSVVMVILRKGENDAINYLIRKDSDNLPSFQVKSTTTDSNFALGSATDWGPDEWHYVVGTWEGDSIKIYVDGALAGSDAASGTPLTDTGPLHIGDNTQGSAQWDGLIDEVRVSARALTASEVADNYRLEVGTYSWKAEAYDGANLAVSETRTFNIDTPVNDPPEVTLLSPPDDSSTTERHMELSALVDDPDGNQLTVSFYGDQNPIPTTLLHQESGVSVPTTINYEWRDGGSEFGVGDSTLGLWHLNDNTGSTVSDATAYGHDGTITGATWTTGKFGSALDFDGSGDRVEVPSTTALQVAGPMTIEAWVVMRSFNPGASGYNVIARKGGNANINFIIRAHDGAPSFEVHTDVDTYEAVGTGSEWSLGSWHYMAGVWDGSYARLYVDGEQIDSVAGSGTPLIDDTVFIMGDRPTGGSDWDGLIDEVRYTNGALTSEQIADVYRLENGTYYWRVHVSDGVLDSTSEIRRFTIGSVPPTVPTLIAPADLALINDTTPTFEWSFTTGMGGTYTLEYAMDTGFTTGVVTVAGLADTTYTVAPGDALADGVWYWHVEAFNTMANGSGYQTDPFEFTLDATPPAAPMLIAPANLAATNDTTPTFNWSPTAGLGGTYTLQYAEDSNFTIGVVTQTGLADTTYTVAPGGALADGVWYWHVEATDQAGNPSGYQSTPFSFTVDTQAPTAPILIDPPDLTVTNDNTPTFDWSPTAAGGTYTLEYAEDSGFTTGVVTETGIADTTFTVAPDDTLADGVWYWHVQAIDAAGNPSGYQGTPFSFTVDTEAPAVPSLINPPDSATIGDNTPTFDWSATAGAGGTYTLEMASDSDFAFVVSVSGLADTSYEQPTPILDGDYYWHVKAIDQAGNEGAYQTRPFMFTVDLGGAPAVPDLLTPPDSSFTCDTTPTFIWTDVTPAAITRVTGKRGDIRVAAAAPTAITYTLQYGPDSAFAQVTTVTGLSDATYTVLDQVAIDYATCYWRVEAVDGAHHSGYQDHAFQFGLFTAGDQNADDVVTAADIIYLVGYVFKSGPFPLPCEAAGDVNCDGVVNASDIIYLVIHVFKSGPPPCNVGDLIADGTWSCP